MGHSINFCLFDIFMVFRRRTIHQHYPDYMTPHNLYQLVQAIYPATPTSDFAFSICYYLDDWNYKFGEKKVLSLIAKQQTFVEKMKKLDKPYILLSS